MVTSEKHSHDFVFALLHGKWASAVKGEVLTRLLNSGTVENLQRQLRTLGIQGYRRETFHRDLAVLHIRKLEEIADMLEPSARQYYHAIAQLAYFDNLKTLLTTRFCSDGNEDLSDLIVQAASLPRLDAEAALAAKSTAGFLASVPLPAGVSAEQFAGIVQELEDSEEPMQMECALDRLCYGEMLHAAKQTCLEMRKPAMELMRLWMDIVNLNMLFRVVRTYHFATEVLDHLWLEGGALPVERLTEWAQSRDTASIASVLPEPFKTLLVPLASGELYRCENTLWNFLFQQAARHFRNLAAPAHSIAAYPVLLHFQTLNLGRIFEGVHFGIPSREMQDMMIGA